MLGEYCCRAYVVIHLGEASEITTTDQCSWSILIERRRKFFLHQFTDTLVLTIFIHRSHSTQPSPISHMMEFEKNNVDELDAVERELDEVDKVEAVDGGTTLIKKPAVPEERGKKKNKKIARQNSKEAALGVSGVSWSILGTLVSVFVLIRFVRVLVC